MELKIELRGVEALVARHAGLRKELEDALYSAIREQTNDTRRMARQWAPRFSGRLRRDIRVFRSRRRLTGRVKSTAPHAFLVSHGRRAGKMPSVDPARASNPRSAQRLRDWAQAHGIHPFVLARAIARKGTVAQPFMAQAESAAKLTFPAKVADAVHRVLARYR